MDKYSIPNIPSTQHILEDLSDLSVVELGAKINLNPDEDILQNVYQCYLNFKQLEGDQERQIGLNMKLADLNQKLEDNIADMKSRTITTK